jgi:hypothetical protein
LEKVFGRKKLLQCLTPPFLSFYVSIFVTVELRNTDIPHVCMLNHSYISLYTVA